MKTFICECSYFEPKTADIKLNNYRRKLFNKEFLKIVFFLGILLLSGKSFGQKDLITTQAGEKIRCRILEETPNRFIYAYLNSAGKVIRSEIFKNLVSDFRYNFYETDIMPATSSNQANKKTDAITKKQPSQNPLAEKVPTNDYQNHLKFRVGARAGFGQLLTTQTGTSIYEYGLYKEKLHRGWTFGADAAYFFNDYIGLGAVYHNFQSRNKSVENLQYFDVLAGKEQNGIIANKISNKYIAPIIYLRKNIDFKTMVILGLSGGKYFYKDIGSFPTNSYIAKGQTYGASATLGIDFLLGNDIIGRDVILSLEAGYNYGKLKTLDYGNGAVALASPLDINRVDLTIGMRFTRFPKYLRLTSY